MEWVENPTAYTGRRRVVGA